MTDRVGGDVRAFQGLILVSLYGAEIMSGSSALAQPAAPSRTLSPSTTLDEKICVFAAAQRLPAIPGLTISSARTKDVYPVVAVSALLSGFSSTKEAVDAAERHFNGITPAEMQARPDAPPDPDKLRPFLAREIEKRIEGAMMVEIDIRAISRYATYNFACVWGGGASALVVGVGISN